MYGGMEAPPEVTKYNLYVVNISLVRLYRFCVRSFCASFMQPLGDGLTAIVGAYNNCHGIA